MSFTPTKRAEVVFKSGRCLLCLTGKHERKECPRDIKCTLGRCAGSRHHPLLHGSEFIPLRKLSDLTSPAASTSTAFLGTLTQRQTVKRRVRFKIVPVRISVGARWVDTFGFLDTGSDTTLIRSDVVKRLGLVGQPKRINVVSYDGSTSNVQASVVNFSLSSIDGTSRFEVKHAYAVDNLKVTPNAPISPRQLECWTHLRGIDVPNVQPEDVGVLIGLDVAEAHDHIDSVKPPAGTIGPIAFKTPFGWCLGGQTGPPQDGHPFIAHLVAEELGLMWKTDNVNLPDNRATALKRLFSMERRFQRDEDFARKQWRHVSGINNPADLCSRGIDPKNVEELVKFHEGPPFLKLDPSEWNTWDEIAEPEESDVNVLRVFAVKTEEENHSIDDCPYGSPPRFDLDENKGSFELWHQQWKIFLALSTIDIVLDDDERPAYKTNILISCLSKETLQAVMSMGLTDAEMGNHETVIQKLRERCNAGRNRHVWRQHFALSKQRANEAADNWLCDLRDLARKCATLTLDQAIEILRVAEAASKQATNLKTGDAAAIQTLAKSAYKKNKTHRQFSTSSNRHPAKERQSNKQPKEDGKSDGCWNCGSQRHPRQQCPANGKECSKCAEIGHFARVCNAKKNGIPPQIGSITLQKPPARIASMEEMDFVEAGMQPSGSEREILISILPDTGAQIDAIPADMYRNEIPETKLLPRGTNAITAIGSPIVSRGTFKATIRWPTGYNSNSKSINTTFHVLQDLKQPILSKKTQKALGMLPAGYPHESINAITKEEPRKDPGSIFFPHLMASVVINPTEERKKEDLKKLTEETISPGMNFFTVIDALKGYHQVQLDEESSALTTFSTPFGRYQYLRLPRRVSEVFDGIENSRRIVEDVIVFSATYEEHVKLVRRLFQRAADHNIAINVGKIVFAQPTARFGGYIVSSHGFQPNPDSIKVIREFLRPKNITDVRAFHGLCQQVGNFSTKVAESLKPLSPLLKKGLMWEWTTTHEDAFLKARKALSETHDLAFYDQKRPTALHVDASRLHGLGFIWKQRDADGSWRMVQAGSRYLSEAESRYAMIELECLGAVWAMQKCRQFIEGLPTFELITDHKPLMQRYQFKARWVPGKENIDSDALSRAPIDVASQKDELAEGANFFSAKLALINAISGSDASVLDPVLERIKIAAKKDKQMIELRETSFIINGFPNDKCNLSLSLRPFWRMRSQLAIDETDGMIVAGARVVIPAECRKPPLRDALPAHRRSFAPEWQQKVYILEKRARRAKDIQIEHYNRTAHPLQPFSIGDHVIVQHPISKCWATQKSAQIMIISLRHQPVVSSAEIAECYVNECPSCQEIRLRGHLFSRPLIIRLRRKKIHPD
ncbi:hypothetical protein GHT06_000605 [Daphnia sinensis]|uniref:CCHC-type domain-containing protein n=1 Tax=Daphnia sinensis TaxID=1820382 RepID=A0AAD5KWH2_9CRUS|nr:hypothetical protein GHT06_000605 [Daphnia sinensis]